MELVPNLYTAPAQRGLALLRFLWACKLARPLNAAFSLGVMQRACTQEALNPN